MRYALSSLLNASFIIPSILYCIKVVVISTHWGNVLSILKPLEFFLIIYLVFRVLLLFQIHTVSYASILIPVLEIVLNGIESIELRILVLSSICIALSLFHILAFLSEIIIVVFSAHFFNTRIKVREVGSSCTRCNVLLVEYHLIWLDLLFLKW